MEKIIAYCGLDCAECGAYKATQNNDQALKEQLAAEWAELYNFDFTPDMINCTSCKGGGAKIGHCYECEVRKCASEKNLVNCGACADFRTCKPINEFLTIAPDAAKNLIQSQ